jgi:pyrimidine deaminase RibD-like protein
MDDTFFMKRALDLARRGAGLVSPNPMVGAVIVNQGEVVGEGFHLYEGLRHAESYAIEMAGGRARGATLYCSLEPCSHHGRTPPCADALVEAGISRALIATRDPDLRVSGRGIERLLKAGIKVEVGLCEEEAARLNEAFFKYAAHKTAFVHRVFDSSEGRWMPSNEFLSSALHYDALLADETTEAARTICAALRDHRRHRPLVLIKPQADGLAVFEGEGQRPRAVVRDTRGLLESLASLRVTSILVLSSSAGFEAADKLTLISPGVENPKEVFPRLEQVVRATAGNYVELTGYPPKPTLHKKSEEQVPSGT